MHFIFSGRKKDEKKIPKQVIIRIILDDGGDPSLISIKSQFSLRTMKFSWLSMRKETPFGQNKLHIWLTQTWPLLLLNEVLCCWMGFKRCTNEWSWCHPFARILSLQENVSTKTFFGIDIYGPLFARDWLSWKDFIRLQNWPMNKIIDFYLCMFTSKINNLCHFLSVSHHEKWKTNKEQRILFRSIVTGSLQQCNSWNGN